MSLLFLHNWKVRPHNKTSTHKQTRMPSRDGLGFFSLICISPFTCESHCPRTNYPPLSVQFCFCGCALACLLDAHCVCHTFFPSSGPLGGVSDWQVASVRNFSTRKPSWISFRAGPVCVGGDRELELTVAISVRFQLKGWLYLTISGKWGRSKCVCVGGGVIPLPQVR